MKHNSTIYCFLLFVFMHAHTIIKAQSVNVTDSLALVDLYNSTNGSNWTNHTNWLTGPVNSWYGVMVTGTNVTEILLGENNLKGGIPASIGNVSNLSELDLNNNQLSGNIPPELGNLSKLSDLILANNQLSGSIPPEIGNLSNLSDIGLSYNQLSGNIPPELGNLSKLALLYLNNNQLNGSIPPELGNLGNLDHFSLDHNQLSGSIPPELVNLNAYDIGLSYNQLTGPIPSGLGTHNSYSLFLNNNELSGNIPDVGGPYLEFLNLDNNKLSGQIPTRIGQHTTLGFLDLSNNKLKGPIPASIGKLVNLQHLYLDHNELSGSIPSTIANLNVDSLDISHNQFTFDGMELVAQTFPFAKYDSQANISLHLNDGELSVSAGGTLSNDTYQWYEVGQQGSTTITGDSVYHPSQDDKYYAVVTNTICTRLTLYTDTIDFGSILPVTIINFAATQQKSFVQLAWTSVTETNISRYEILRSANSINFSTIGSLPAKGNGTTQQDYSFNDLQSREGNNYYMLKIIDKDGTSVYSNIVLVNLGKSKEITMVYPNPAKDILHIQTKGSVSISLLNQDGKILLTENITNTGSINVSGMAAGIYYLKNNNTNVVQKIFIEK